MSGRKRALAPDYAPIIYHLSADVNTKQQIFIKFFKKMLFSVVFG